MLGNLCFTLALTLSSVTNFREQTDSVLRGATRRKESEKTANELKEARELNIVIKLIIMRKDAGGGSELFVQLYPLTRYIMKPFPSSFG